MVIRCFKYLGYEHMVDIKQTRQEQHVINRQECENWPQGKELPGTYVVIIHETGLEASWEKSSDMCQQETARSSKNN